MRQVNSHVSMEVRAFHVEIIATIGSTAQTGRTSLKRALEYNLARRINFGVIFRNTAYRTGKQNIELICLLYK